MKKIMSLLMLLIFLFSGCNTHNHQYSSNVIEPTCTENGYTYINLGGYPQTVVTEETIISSLSTISETNELGYIEYNDNEYKKVVAEPYKSSYTFINGNTIYANNYEYSSIRAWLNGYNGSSYNVTNYSNIGFFDIAFTEEEQALIKTTLVDNSVETTGTSSKYVCNNTKCYFESPAAIKTEGQRRVT